MNYYTYHINTSKPFDMVNIDKYIINALEESRVDDGILLVYTPHTTAGITINENADPDVKRDLLYAFNILSPQRSEYRHFEGNSHSHLLSSLVGPSESFIIDGGSLLLGRWQSVYFCEFDGPRNNRKIHIKIIKS